MFCFEKVALEYVKKRCREEKVFWKFGERSRSSRWLHFLSRQQAGYDDGCNIIHKVIANSPYIRPCLPDHWSPTTWSSTRRWCSFLTVQNKKNKGFIAKFGNCFFCLLLKCLNVFWLPGWGKTSSCTVLLTSLSCKSIYNPKFYFNLRDRYLFADQIFCIQVSNCLIADTDVPESAL